MNRPPSLVLDPARVIVALAGEVIMVASTSVPPVLTVTALAVSCAVTVVNSSQSSLWATGSMRKRTNAVRSSVASVPENPQNRRKEARSSSASARLTSGRSYRIESSRALNVAKGGQAASPLSPNKPDQEGLIPAPNRSACQARRTMMPAMRTQRNRTAPDQSNDARRPAFLFGKPIESAIKADIYTHLRTGLLACDPPY